MNWLAGIGIGIIVISLIFIIWFAIPWIKMWRQQK